MNQRPPFLTYEAIQKESEIFLKEHHPSGELPNEQYEQKYRFTIAHEVGHLILHKRCYEGVNYTNLDEFLLAYGSIDGIDMGWFETQASWFAELVLVPTVKLKEICTNVVRDRAHDIRNVGGLTATTWSYLANDIARPFNVSPAVVECRIGRAGMRDSRVEDLT